jgi:hypothetical protein
MLSGMDKIKRLLATAILYLVATGAHATGIEMTDRWYIQLDAGFYSVNAGVWNLGSNLIALGSLTTSLSNCRRSSGAAQVATINRLSYANGTKVVYLQSAISQYSLVRTNGVMVLQLFSATVDVICDGAVPDPTVPAPPSVLFANGFE